MGEILISESDTGYAPVFQAIRQYFWLSASISGYLYKLTPTIEIQSRKKIF